MFSRIIIQITTVLLAICAMAVATAQGSELSNKQKLENICKQFKRPCTIIYDNSKRIEGYTTIDGRIVLSLGLRQVLTDDEIFAVGLHEVGHHIQRHYDRQYQLLTKHPNISQSELIEFRYTMEYEADRFATFYYLHNDRFNYLPSALRHITAKDKVNLATNTHPSTYDRIERMRQLETNYNTSYSRRIQTKQYRFKSISLFN